MGEKDSDQPKPYLLTEAASLTGLSVDAIRKRILRRKLRGNRSNEDGLWRVWLTETDIEAAKAGRLAGQDVDNPSDESRTINALEALAAMSQEALTQQQMRAEKAEARADAVQAEAAKLREEGAALAVRVAVAETEAKGLREALEEARRPFWRRWLG